MAGNKPRGYTNADLVKAKAKKAAQAKADKAKADAAAKANALVPAKDVFTNYFSVYFPDVNQEKGWLSKLYSASKPFYKQGYKDADIPDLLLSSDKAPAEYKQRFAGIEELKKKQAAGQPIAHIPSVAEYATMSREMKTTLNKYGLNSLGDNATIAKIIGNDVDQVELGARLDNAFFAIDNADSFLKQQLATSFPTLSRSDLAKALLTGADGAQELKKKVEIAGIKASASEFGLQNQASAEELYKMGVNRADARKGYAQTQQEISGLQAAQEQFGKTSDIAAELEKVNVTGGTSSEVKRLKSQARGQFQGTNGISPTALTKNKTGQV